MSVGRAWTPGMMSSTRIDWATPVTLFQMLDSEFHFTLDVCADPSNAKCPQYFDEPQNGLTQDWSGTCWMNPPYGKRIGYWIEKAYRESRHGATVVCLLPARTDTTWWHDYCLKGEIRFLRRRLKFGDGKKEAPFPSAIVIFRPAVPCEATA